MNWLRRILGQKHSRDRKNTYLYHISPDRHNVLRGRSFIGFPKSKTRQQGLYFSPSYKSLLQDWAPYVASKGKYDTLFIHKVIVPQWVMEESYRRQDAVFNEQNEAGTASIGFWGWGAQVFVPDDLLPYLQIVDIKKYSWADIMDKITDLRRGRRQMEYTKSKEEEQKEKERLSDITVENEIKRRRELYDNSNF